MNDILAGAAVSAAVFVLVVVVLVQVIKALIIIVPPNRAAVITGRRRISESGEATGYRTVIGGRTLRIPIIESVDYISLETIPIEISVSNAFSKGNIPLQVEAIANVKIASEPETVFNNAVERLLDKSPEEVRDLARDTLMGNLRGVLATLTPEEVNEDRLGFASALAEDAGEDLAALGFHLDVLKIQNVHDERGYLAAIGRRKSAEAVRDAEVAEAQAEADTREAAAAARQRAEVREAEANIDIAEARNRLRVRQAHLDQEAETAERVAVVKAAEAEVVAQRALEVQRVERERERLRADVVEPANAERDAARARAEGEAAPILERGKAQAEVLRRIAEEIRDGGDQGFGIFIAEKLPELLATSVDAIRGVEIDRLIVLDGGDGEGVSNAANQRVKGAFGTLEGIAASLGLDLEEVIRAANRKALETGAPHGTPPTAARGGGGSGPGNSR
jgi:flotillin